MPLRLNASMSHGVSLRGASAYCDEIVIRLLLSFSAIRCSGIAFENVPYFSQHYSRNLRRCLEKDQTWIDESPMA